MNINDEHISAFLDGELEAHEMAAMRAVIAEDEAVAARIEAFAAVDASLKQRYSAIDDRPMPEGLMAMIQAAGATTHAKVSAKPTAQVIELSRWQRTKQQVQEHFAVAASVALMLGVGLGYFASPFATQPSTLESKGWQHVAQHLNDAPSGELRELGSGAAIKVQLSFKGQDGALCRQYYQQSADATQASDNVACNYGGQWQLTARVPTAIKQQGTYATASKSAAIDRVLDSIMADSPMSFEQEQRAIAKQWRAE